MIPPLKEDGQRSMVIIMNHGTNHIAACSNGAIRKPTKVTPNMVAEG